MISHPGGTVNDTKFELCWIHVGFVLKGMSKNGYDVKFYVICILS